MRRLKHIILVILLMLSISNCNNSEYEIYNLSDDVYNYNYDCLKHISVSEFLQSVTGNGIEIDFLVSEFERNGLIIKSREGRMLFIYFDINSEGSEDTVNVNKYKNKKIQRIRVFDNHTSGSLIIDYALKY